MHRTRGRFVMRSLLSRCRMQVSAHKHKKTRGWYCKCTETLHVHPPPHRGQMPMAHTSPVVVLLKRVQCWFFLTPLLNRSSVLFMKFVGTAIMCEQECSLSAKGMQWSGRVREHCSEIFRRKLYKQCGEQSGAIHPSPAF